MQCFEHIPEEQQNTAVALGFFDGLHIGHRSVLELAADQRRNGLTPLCLTFSQSPKSVLAGKQLPMLMTREDKTRALERIGFEHTVFADFRKIMDLSAERFVNEILSDTLHAKKLYCGFNYRFGKNAEGDAQALRLLCERYGLKLHVLPPAEDEGEVVSSSLIKSLILRGEVSRANRLLCGEFGFAQTVTHGKHLGRKLGAPTINQTPFGSLITPLRGVYCSRVTLENGEAYCGVTNVGIKPTVGGTTLLWETYMPKYTGGEIYGQSADVRLLDFIRPEKQFESLDALKAEILLNSQTALEIYEQKLILNSNKK